jgi:hypothetical protein
MWTLTLFRALSGVQNALYYAKLDMIAKLWALVLIGYIAYMLEGWYILSAIGVVFSYLSFEGKLWKGSIHLVEIFKTSLPILAYFVSGGNLVDILLSTYPGLVLHKMVINWGSGQKILSDVTDDPTGRSFTFTVSIEWKWAVNWIHFLWFKVRKLADDRQDKFELENPGWTKIYVPRQTMADRIIWALISIGVWALMYFDILNYLKIKI